MQDVSDQILYKFSLTSVVVDVTEIKFMIPGNEWHSDPKLKEIGRWMCEDVSDGA